MKEITQIPGGGGGRDGGRGLHVLDIVADFGCDFKSTITKNVDLCSWPNLPETASPNQVLTSSVSKAPPKPLILGLGFRGLVLRVYPERDLLL